MPTLANRKKNSYALYIIYIDNRFVVVNIIKGLPIEISTGSLLRKGTI